MTHILIIQARFYPDLADELLKGAVETIADAGATYEIAEVPGAFEIPAALRFGIASERFDGYVALGCVIRGETTHYDYVCAESARGINYLGFIFKAAIGYGILTVENEEQAWMRAGTNLGNKGGSAAQACLEMVALKERLGA